MKELRHLTGALVVALLLSAALATGASAAVPVLTHDVSPGNTVVVGEPFHPGVDVSTPNHLDGEDLVTIRVWGPMTLAATTPRSRPSRSTATRTTAPVSTPATRR